MSGRATRRDLPPPAVGYRWSYVCESCGWDARCLYGRWMQVPAAGGER